MTMAHTSPETNISTRGPITAATLKRGKFDFEKRKRTEGDLLLKRRPSSALSAFAQQKNSINTLMPMRTDELDRLEEQEEESMDLDDLDECASVRKP